MQTAVLIVTHVVGILFYETAQCLWQTLMLNNLKKKPSIKINYCTYQLIKVTSSLGRGFNLNNSDKLN